MAPGVNLGKRRPRLWRSGDSGKCRSGNATRRPVCRRWIKLISAGWVPPFIFPSRGCLALGSEIMQVARPLKNHEDSPHRARHRVADPTVVSMCCRRSLRVTRLRDDAGVFHGAAGGPFYGQRWRRGGKPVFIAEKMLDALSDESAERCPRRTRPVRERWQRKSCFDAILDSEACGSDGKGVPALSTRFR